MCFIACNMSLVLEIDYLNLSILLEYACPVWHAGLTSAKSDFLEQIQKCVIRSIFPNSRYIDALESAHMELLSVRREKLNKQFFKKYVQT